MMNDLISRARDGEREIGYRIEWIRLLTSTSTAWINRSIRLRITLRTKEKEQIKPIGLQRESIFSNSCEEKRRNPCEEPTHPFWNFCSVSFCSLWNGSKVNVIGQEANIPFRISSSREFFFNAELRRRR